MRLGKIQKDLRLVYTIMKSIYFLPILFKQNLETPATPLFFVSNGHRANNLNFLNECSREPDPFPLSYLKKQLFKNIKQQVLVQYTTLGFHAMAEILHLNSDSSAIHLLLPSSRTFI